MRYTHNPIAWENWKQERLGEELYRELRSLALSGEKVDMPDLLARLRDEVRAA